ncbi:MAG: hypothetical protein SPG42_08585 [Candidatus Cryptobacteroides sp.]|nr:hypothetical protein [Candidatus Cryptobacteroides sp.]
MKSLMSFSFCKVLLSALFVPVSMFLISSCDKAGGEGMLRLSFSGWVSQPPKSLVGELLCEHQVFGNIPSRVS